MPFIPLIRNQRGIALLYLIILFTLLGVLIGTGSRMLGSTVTRGKVNDTKAELTRTAQVITAWAAKNGHLPDANEYPGIFGSSPLDAWGKPLVYAYDSNLTTVTTGGLCGRTRTAISHYGRDVAFLLVSGGDDMGINSTPATSGVYSGDMTGLAGEDLSQIITLDELQAQAGCAGTTQGSLRILNNELPKACRGIGYSATLFADGGVPPVSFTMTGLPAGITNSGAVLSGTTSVASGTYPVAVSASDSQTPSANLQQRKYFMNVTTCN